MCWQESPIGPGHSRSMCCLNGPSVDGSKNLKIHVKWIVQTIHPPPHPQKNNNSQHPTPTPVQLEINQEIYDEMCWKKQQTLNKLLVKSAPCCFFCSFFLVATSTALCSQRPRTNIHKNDMFGDGFEVHPAVALLGFPVGFRRLTKRFWGFL